MRKLIKICASLNLTFFSSISVISCSPSVQENHNFDLSTISDDVFIKYPWTVDQMLGSSIGKFSNLHNTVAKIISNNYPQLNILKINIDIYYGAQNEAKEENLINFNSVKNLMPITNFTIHITANKLGNYQHDKWVNINKNIDIASLPIFQQWTPYENNPASFSSYQLITGFVNNINNILHSSQGYKAVVEYYQINNLWDSANPLLSSMFNLEVNLVTDVTDFVTFNLDLAQLVFNSEADNSLYKNVFSAKGFMFQTIKTFPAIWNVKIASEDFNSDDWRNIDWKTIPNKVYSSTTTVQDVIEDVRTYLINWAAHVHGSHFMLGNDINVILKKGYQPNPDDAWDLNTKLIDLWKAVDHDNLNYVYAWIQSSNNPYINIDNTTGSAGTHITFQIGEF